MVIPTLDSFQNQSKRDSVCINGQVLELYTKVFGKEIRKTDSESIFLAIKAFTLDIIIMIDLMESAKLLGLMETAI